MSEFNELELLSSRQNSLVKEALSLKSSRQAKKYGLMLLEGIRQITTALQASTEPAYILFSDDASGNYCYQTILRFIEDGHGFNDLNLRRVESGLFKQISDTEHPQGIIAVFRSPKILSLKGEKAKEGCYLALEDCRDPGNMGAIIRTVEALNLDGLILLGDCVWPYNPKSLRSAMGSALFLKIYQAENLSEVKEFTSNLDLLAADLEGEDLAKYRPRAEHKGFVLVLGNEAHGLSPELRKEVDGFLKIVMGGKAESLNLAGSAAIMAWALRELY